MWDFGDGIKDSSNVTPTHTYAAPGTYTVNLIATNSFGCKDTILKTIDVKPGFTFYIPNAFSPNSDGVNDIFKGTGIGIKDYTLLIYDRWGNLVFKSTNLENGWDGTFKGSEVTLEDVFVWKVELHDEKNKEHDYKGTVSLIK